MTKTPEPAASPTEIMKSINHPAAKPARATRGDFQAKTYQKVPDLTEMTKSGVTNTGAGMSVQQEKTMTGQTIEMPVNTGVGATEENTVRQSFALI